MIDYMKEWNYLVDEHSRNLNESEDKIQTLWESYLSHPFQFGYENAGEVKSKYSLHIGSTDREAPDIMLQKGNNILCVIELKRYTLSKNDNFEKQLLNYMTHTDLHLSVGVLICNKLYMYWYDHSQNKSEFLEIPFERNNENGATFVQLFIKENYDEEKIRAFVHEHIHQAQNISAIKNEVTVELIRKLLSEYFSHSYAQDDCDEALSQIPIAIGHSSAGSSYNFAPVQAEDFVARDGKEDVVINGISLPRYRDSATSVQDFVKQTLKTLFDNNLLSTEEIKRLQEKEYCQRTFGIQFPLLQKEWKNCFDGAGKPRYWGYSPSKKIGGFYVCSQWWKHHFSMYDLNIANWLTALEVESNR